jgi:hypothetical protein
MPMPFFESSHYSQADLDQEWSELDGDKFNWSELSTDGLMADLEPERETMLETVRDQLAQFEIRSRKVGQTPNSPDGYGWQSYHAAENAKDGISEKLLIEYHRFDKSGGTYHIVGNTLERDCINHDDRLSFVEMALTGDGESGYLFAAKSGRATLNREDNNAPEGAILLSQRDDPSDETGGRFWMERGKGNSIALPMREFRSDSDMGRLTRDEQLQFMKSRLDRFASGDFYQENMRGEFQSGVRFH